ncbi:hypothetical protein P153DRAFT_357010 [Dothidotthia symphoricarpi CBS 119687]|uniref:Bacteriophage T5 Orf172 DNA-binding domain-containing protein n=1 Tax=Dothidotthia symphoricarpi CBS 119687 TaxID=1392245 RepID=A0A6A6ABY6_9PLEO|nr:uncharacterized protein P153DRAFT_357010 [Dothidotthia symphoricarpi CBS 119687]KAF2129432.1 hypothetical protein P153DRAFT_357010 [Dothidotthia symphoricarpi CBS 119687]
MPRRSSLIVPLAQPTSTHRRRSANARLITSVQTPKTLQTPGSSSSQPISIPSDSENDEEDDDDDTISIRQKSNTKKSRSDTSQPRPSSGRTPRSGQPTTPERARPAPARHAATDPGILQSARRSEFNGSPISYPRIYWPYCKFMAYAYSGAMRNHQKTCDACLEKEEMLKEDKREEEENQPKEEPAVHTPRESATEMTHDDDDNTRGDETDERDLQVKDTKKDNKISAQLLHNRLIVLAKESLTKKEDKGYIYIFRDPQKKGLLKIGHTTNVNKRGKQHEKCGLKLDWVHISGGVKLVKRAEQLVKLDMKHLCRPWKCSICCQKHGEWFEIEEEKAKGIMNRWVKWINERDPYQEDLTLDPIWKFLMDYGRMPQREIGHNDHEARQLHWIWVLSQPTSSDKRRFEEHKNSRRHDDSEAQSTIHQHRDSDKSVQQHAPKYQETMTAPSDSAGIGHVIRTLADGGQDVKLTIRIEIKGNSSTSRMPQG